MTVLPAGLLLPSAGRRNAVKNGILFGVSLNASTLGP
jgi:hypothetical protein